MNRAESILKKFLAKRECTHIEKLLIAIRVNEKRLMDVDEQLDDPDLENLVTEDEWTYIEKEKFTGAQQKDLNKLDWFKRIQI